MLTNINLSIEEGEFVALVGRSGCGKTTLMSLIAGLLPPDAGSIALHGKPITGPGPDRGVIFQNYSLLPWLTVAGNVRLAIDQVFADWTAEQRQAQVERYLRMVNLWPARDKRPGELSGGMRQRVAVARALAMNPAILLMDEPLSALDALTRATLQDEIMRIWEESRTTVVLITNDVDEAILMADRLIPLTAGPTATLGPSFEIPLPRPRDRRLLNRDPQFKQLRSEVVEYLLDQGRTARRAKLQPNLPGGLRMNPRYLELWRVSKSYPKPGGGEAVIVQDFNLTIQQGEFVSLIGHSGCGKSTVLSMIAGLSKLSGGGMVLDHREIVAAGPDRGIVFQSPCLLPWLTALENVQLGVDEVLGRSQPRAARRALAAHYLELVGLGDSLQKRPAQLSQGMRQRVGIARAFALQPKVLLLDEPFGMLDAITRLELQEVLIDLWTQDNKTAVMVTHDVDEALLLSDRIVMMTNGPEARVGDILEVPFVAAATPTGSDGPSRLLPAARALRRIPRGAGTSPAR